LTETKQFEDFNWHNLLDSRMTEEKYKAFIGQFNEIHDEVKNSEKESILGYIDFCMELVETDKIDLDYIHNLIVNIDWTSEQTVKDSCKQIKKLVEKSESDSLHERRKKDLINNFLENMILERQSSNVMKSITDIDEAFRKYIESEKRRDIYRTSEEYGIDNKELEELIQYQEVTNKKITKNLNEALNKTKNKTFREKKSMIKRLEADIKKIIEIFKL
jgi:type I restriction enzyme R subunit